jgi:hypothetical protein
MTTLDPILASVIASKPELEKEIYQTFLAADLDEAITGFTNTPTWVLTTLFDHQIDTKQSSWAFSPILRHPNFDLSLIDQIIADNEHELFNGIVHNPTIGAKRLIAITKGKDEIAGQWANYYLIKDTPKAEEFVLAELKKKKAEERNFTLSHLLQTSHFSEDFVDLLMKKHLKVSVDRYSQEEVVGKILAQNPRLSQENRAALHLLGYNKEASNTNTEPDYLASSRLFPTASTVKQGKASKSLLKAIAAAGHPFAAIDDDYKDAKIEISELNLFQLIKAEFLHRALWTELVGFDGFELNYRNGYRVMDLFIHHDVLGEKFQDADYDDGWAVGGVLAGYDNRIWIDTEESIEPDRAAELLTSYGESWEEIIYSYETLSELYAPALAHFLCDETYEEYTTKYGVKLTTQGEMAIAEAAAETADQEDFDVEAFLAENFTENLSWKKLSSSKKDQIFELLTFGLTCSNKDLRNDSEHFLGCIALHPATPKSMLKQLEALGNELVTATLARRNA